MFGQVCAESKNNVYVYNNVTEDSLKNYKRVLASLNFDYVGDSADTGLPGTAYYNIKNNTTVTISEERSNGVLKVIIAVY